MSRADDNVYDALNLPVLDKVPQNTRKVLDIGCGTGTLGKALKNRCACEVTGITHSKAEADLATKHLDRVIVCDLDGYDFSDLKGFDCIICSHVLEHLREPRLTLTRLRPNLLPQGRLIVALPNALHWRQRMEFLLGRFRYADGGIMDKTHLRFFDWSTARSLVASSGYKVIHSLAVGNFPQPVFRRILPVIAKRIDKTACLALPGLFGWQFVVIAEAAVPKVSRGFEIV
jgi:SAM-dependent methyltransferase